MSAVSTAEAGARLRRFLQTESPPGRRPTADWLAGRLGIPRATCRAALGRLAEEGVVRRHRRRGADAWFEAPTPDPLGWRDRIAVAATTWAFAVVALVGGAALDRGCHLLSALGLGIALLVLAAWADWQLADRPRDKG